MAPSTLPVPATELVGRDAALQGRRVLLVLDNFQHLAAAADTVAELLATTVQMKVLVTSRARCASGASTKSMWRRWPCLASRCRPTSSAAMPLDEARAHGSKLDIGISSDVVEGRRR